jgi:hypothetical protein
VKQGRLGEGGVALALCAALIAVAACRGSGDAPMPVPGFGVLSGQMVLVLPVQYVRPVPGGWVARAANAEAAARQADLEIAFALGERGGLAMWVTPDQQIEALRRRPSIRVNPYAFSADELRQKADKLRQIRDPLYGEIRLLAALFDSRYAVWPLELVYVPEEDGTGGRLAIRTFLLDTRAGTVLWSGLVRGNDQPPASPGALAAAAQAFAFQVSP